MRLEDNHLWGAVDSHGFAEDEFDGPGINWWLDYDGMTTDEEFVPLLANQVDLWDDVDYCVPAVKSTFVVPREIEVIVIRR